ncbi:HpcH/HpaI aldolase family protein [Microvirga massiliensis]|uniref:HpcH/HpaI aldolase family protein n=1 Tax=Microvirga massiliensis TaxID=1033741 RepID=UPI00062BEB00|nr:aldolase/citrate lyase family protein [Microvirga massiliensis]
MSSVQELGDRLRAGNPAFSAWCGLLEPGIAGLLAREPFDAITLDMQHGAIDLATLIRAIPLVVAAGKPVLARIPVGDFATASRLLDSGVSGIIAPMINTVEDARRFGRFTKFPPLGERSWGPHAAVALSGLSPTDYFTRANGFSIALAMIETREALGIVDDILATPGVDGVFIGPADLSIALSNGGVVDPASPEVEKALDHVLARARAANRFAAVYAPTGERAAVLARRGFDLIAIGSDITYLRTGAAQALAAARASAKGA